MVRKGDKIHICGYSLEANDTLNYQKVEVEDAEGTITKITKNGEIYGTWGKNFITVNDVFYGIY